MRHIRKHIEDAARAWELWDFQHGGPPRNGLRPQTWEKAGAASVKQRDKHAQSKGVFDRRQES